MVEININVSEQIEVVCSNCGQNLVCDYNRKVLSIQICNCRNSVIQDLKDHNDHLQDELAELRDYADESNMDGLADSLDKALKRVSELEAELDLYHK